MTKILNLTPHVIKIGGGTVGAEFPASGNVARVAMNAILDSHATAELGLPIMRQVPGPVVGLPDAVEGVWLIVSAMVRTACPNRADLLSPGELIRDTAGQPVGCIGLVRN